MSGKVYEEEHTVKYYEGDTLGRMSLPMLINNLIHVSETQSSVLGVDDAFVKSRGLSWIILQYGIEIKRMPRITEKVRIQTQAMSYNKLFCYRDFNVRDEAGEEIVTVHSTFALMDLEKRKMVRVPQEVIAPYESEFTKRLIRTPQPEKVNEEKLAAKTYRVRYLDIDQNKHVNNSKYFEWALDALGYDFLATHELISMNIKFEKEVQYGEQVQSEYSLRKIEEGQVLSAHRIVTEGKTNCELSAVWKALEE